MFVLWYPHCGALISSTPIWACTGGTWRLLCCLSLLIWEWRSEELHPPGKTEPPPKQTMLFLLSFAKSCGVDWGLTTSLLLSLLSSSPLKRFLVVMMMQILSILKSKKVIISGLKFHSWGWIPPGSTGLLKIKTNHPHLPKSKGWGGLK